MLCDLAASPSPYCVSNRVKPLPSNAERNPSSRITQESVAAFTLMMPMEPDVTPASFRALSISPPAVLPAALLSVEKVASASTLAGESTYTIFTPEDCASFNADEMASGPLAATMMALAPADTALFTHSICCASSLVLGAINWTVTPSSFAAFCAPSFRVTQCWSMESMVIRATMVSEPAAGASVFAASADACAAVVADTSSVLLPHPVIRDAARPREQASANIFFIAFPPFFVHACTLSHSFYISVREAGP